MLEVSAQVWVLTSSSSDVVFDLVNMVTHTVYAIIEDGITCWTGAASK